MPTDLEKKLQAIATSEHFHEMLRQHGALLLKPHLAVQKIFLSTRHGNFRAAATDCHVAFHMLRGLVMPDTEKGNASLQQMQALNKQYATFCQGQVMSGEISARHNIQISLLKHPAECEPTFADRVAFFAEQLLQKYYEQQQAGKKAPIFIGIFGNNSREGVHSAMALFQALIERVIQRAEKDNNDNAALQILEDIHFTVTSSAGKGTDTNVVEGISLNFANPQHPFFIKTPAGTALAGAAEGVFDHPRFDLKQFGCMRARVVLRSGLADVYNDETQVRIFRNMPVKLGGSTAKPALIFGRTEAARNRHELQLNLRRFAGRVRSLPSEVAQFVAEKVAERIAKNNLFLYEEKSTNTGDNARFAYQVVAEYCRNHDVDVANTQVVYCQKMQASVRAFGTGFIQHAPVSASEPGGGSDPGNAFSTYGYLNGMYGAEDLQYLEHRQFLIWYVCFLKEFIAEQSYLLQDMRFHLPVAYTDASYMLCLRHVSFLYQLLNTEDVDVSQLVQTCLHRTDATFMRETSLLNLHKWFSQALWPQLEPLLLPNLTQPSPKSMILRNAMLPWVAKKLGITAYDDEGAHARRVDEVVSRVTFRKQHVP